MVLPGLAAADSGKPGPAIDISAYPYLARVKNDTDFTATINASLPARFSYFSFMNMRGVVTGGEPSFNRSEQSLRWRVSNRLPLELVGQALLVNGGGNDFWQVGIGWRVSETRFMAGFFERLNLFYRVNYYVKRFAPGENRAHQMEHYFKMKFPGISERLYLSGFLDQSFALDGPANQPPHPIVTELQIGFRMFDRVYANAEYRFNEFRAARNRNIAVGLEYDFRW